MKWVDNKIMDINDLKIKVLMNFSEISSSKIDDIFYKVAIERFETDTILAWLKHFGLQLNYDKKESFLTDKILILHYNDNTTKKNDFNLINDFNKDKIFNINGYLGNSPLTIQFNECEIIKDGMIDDKFINIKNYIRFSLQEVFYNSKNPLKHKKSLLNPGFIPN